MNIVVIEGNLTRDPELRYTGSGTAVCGLRLAVDIPGSEEPMYLDVTCWEKLAEVSAERLRRGSKIVASGTLRPESWTDKDGTARSKITVRAINLTFMSPRAIDTLASDLDAAAEASPRASNDPDQLPF